MAKPPKIRYTIRKMAFLNPTSIAVIGASSQPGKVGHDIFKNLLTQGFPGELYPVNPTHPDILGKKAYPTVTDLPSTPDMAVIVTPAATVEGVLDECGKKGIKTVVIISAGFGEIGTDEGKAREAKLKEIAKNYSINLVGPNCLGVLRPSMGMNASFAKSLPKTGTIALLSQSGALAVALLDQADTLQLGFSLVISMGNKAVMDECDFLEACESDNETQVIGLYLESIKDGQRFLNLAKRIGQKKPIVLIKSGVTTYGQRAVSSHTGALAGSDAAIEAACIQSGIHRAKTTEEFLDILSVLQTQPTLVSPQIAVITNAGGPGILATDKAEKSQLVLPALTPEGEESLKKVLPPAASVHNPIDVLGDAGADRYASAVETAMDDAHIDGLVVLLTPQVMTPVEEIAKAIIDSAKRHPLIPMTVSFVGGSSVEAGVSLLRNEGIPCFETPERAVAALAMLKERKETAESVFTVNNTRKSSAASLLQNQKGLLNEDATQKLLSTYDLPLPKQALATTAVEAKALSKELGFPLIAKISSPDILHKTDVGGVRANLKNEEEVAQAFTEIFETVRSKSPTADLKGVLLQKLLPPGNEFIVGAVRDPSFGPLLMVGLGGIYTELFADTAFRIAPITENDAYAMLEELKSWKLLLGMRGKPQADINALASLLVKVSQMIVECPDIKELDFNPVLVSESGVTVVDAKVVL
jgi:acetyltransferase